MELDIIKSQTTWNDAVGGINSNFAKIKAAFATVGTGGGGGLNEDELRLFLEQNGYTTENWVKLQKYLTAESADLFFARKEWVEQQIEGIDLSPYAKSTDVANTYATISALNTLEGKHNILMDEFNALSNLLSSDTTDYINTWNEVVAFLDGYKDESDLATILSGMNADISSRLLASDFESWKTNTFTPLASLVANHTTRLDGLDQSILSINTRIDGVDKTIEDHIAEFIAFRANFEITDNLILVRKNFASTEEVSAKGINQGTGGGGGSSYSRLDTWDGYDNNKAGYVLSAGLGYGLKVAIDELNGYDLDNRVRSIENSYVSKDAGGVVNGGLVVSSLAIAGGSSSQFLKADGSLDGTSYLSTSGGTLSRSGRDVLTIDTSDSYGPMYQISVKGKITGAIGHIPSESMGDYGLFISNADANTALLLASDRELYFSLDAGRLTKDYTLLHSGNVGDYALKTDGSNTMNGGIKWTLDPTPSSWNSYFDVGGNRGLRILNNVGHSTEGAPSNYAVALAVSGYYGFALAYDANCSIFKAKGFDSTDWKTLAFTDSDITGYALGLMHSNGNVAATADENGRLCLSKQGIGSTDGRLVLFDFDDTHLNVGYSMRNSYITDIYGNTIRFFVGDTPRMLINSAGNVTIGASDLAESNWKTFISGPLAIWDNSRRTINETCLRQSALLQLSSYSIINNDSLFIGQLENATAWIQAAYSGSEANPSKNHTYRIALNPLGGNVGIGTIDPQYKLHVDGSLSAGATTLSSLYVSSDIITNRIIIGGVTLSTEDGVLKIESDMYATGEISAHGLNKGESGGGGSSYSRLDTWGDYDSSKAGYVLSAGLGYDLKLAVDELNGYNLNSRLTTVESNYLSKNGGVATNLTVSGGGTAWISFAYSDTNYGSLGINAEHDAVFYDTTQTRWLLHTGNIGDYALRNDGSNSMGASAFIDWATGEGAEDYSVYGNGIRLLGYNARTQNYMGGIHVGTRYGWQLVRDGYDNKMKVRMRKVETNTWLDEWHTIAFTEDVLSTSGGTINGSLTVDSSSLSPLLINTSHSSGIGLRLAQNHVLKAEFNWDIYAGTYMYNHPSSSYIGVKDDGTPHYNGNTLIHSGNIGNYNAGDSAKLGGYDASVYPTFDNQGTSIGFNLHTDYIKLGQGDGFIEFYDGGWYNSMWGKVTAVNGFVGTLTGNASSATKLQTARTIWGQSFDGTGNVSGNLSDVTYLTIRDYDYGIYKGNYFGSLAASDIVFTAPNLYFYTSRFSMLINSSGNVTIGAGDLAGTSTKLYVDGDTTINGSLSAGATTLSSLTVSGATEIRSDLRLKPSSSNHGSYLKFGDGSYCYLHEDTDDHLKIYADKGVTIANATTIDGDLSVSTINGYTPITSGNIGSQSVKYATSAGSASASDVYDWAKKASLAASDVPNLDWSKITTGKPTTLSGYGIADAYTKIEVNDIASKYLLLEGGTVSGATTFTGGIATNDIHGNGQTLYLGNASNNAFIKVREDMVGSSSMWSIPRDGKATFTSLTTPTLSVTGSATIANVTIDAGTATLSNLTVNTAATLKQLVVGIDGMSCNAPATFNDFIYGSSITPRTDNYYVLGNNNYKWYGVTAYNVNVHEAITIEAGKELRFKDDDGVVHTLKYDSTKQAFVFDGNVNATGEMSAKKLNA